MVSPARSIFAVVTVLGFTACPRLPVDLGKDGEPKSAEELLKRVALAESHVVGIKGDAKLGVDAPQGRGSVTLFVGVFHPALIHIEQLDFFNRPEGVLVTDGEQFGLYDGKQGKYLRGPASAPNLARFLPIVLPPRELAALMLGRVPRIPYDRAEMRFDDKQGGFELKLFKGPVVQTLLVQPPAYRVVKSHVDGVTAYDVELGDVQTFGGVTFAKRASLIATAANTRVELVYKDVTLNEPPDMTMFELTPPENVPIVEVDERGAVRPSAPDAGQAAPP